MQPTAKAALLELLGSSLEIIDEFEECESASMEDYCQYDLIESFKQELARKRKRFTYLAGIVEKELLTESTFGVPFDNCPDECDYLREVANDIENTKLRLMVADNYIIRLNRKLEKVRYEKHVYKVEMNRYRRKLEGVYKYCDDLMTYEVGEHWKKEL